jgi:nucleoside-diphosphate-sugar epimerase
MLVLVTGGIDMVGKGAVAWLEYKGCCAKAIGRDPDMPVSRADFTGCDITEYPALRQVVRGCEVVVHLAAIPRPWDEPK